MSGAIDARLLLYAEDRTSSFHLAARTFLDHLLESEALVYAAWDILHAEDRESAQRIFFTANATHSPFRLECRLRRPEYWDRSRGWRRPRRA